MADDNMNRVDVLLSKLDRKQLEEFIRNECGENSKFRNRFLALGLGSVFAPTPEAYSDMVHDLIDDYSSSEGYIKYRDTFEFNRDMTNIFDETIYALENKQWNTALAILTGVADCLDDILYSGDDSAGELSSIVEIYFNRLFELASEDDLPQDIRDKIFKMALTRFNSGELKGSNWWWSWIELALDHADNPEKEDRLKEAMKTVEQHSEGWSAEHDIRTAQSYILEIMSKRGTLAEQRKFMYDNVSNPEFRDRLMEMAWDEKNYDEVLRLAKEGEAHDSTFPGLISDWRKWELKVYRQTDDKENILRLARFFFFNGGRFGEKEYYMGPMYDLMKSLINNDKWPEFVESLLKDENCIRSTHELFIYTQEKMWSRYMEYLRNNPNIYYLKNAPEEVREQYHDEFIALFAKRVRQFFLASSNRKDYSEGVQLLKELLQYGGTKEAQSIIEEQKSRKPRRPALIDELSKI